MLQMQDEYENDRNNLKQRLSQLQGKIINKRICCIFNQYS